MKLYGILKSYLIGVLFVTCPILLKPVTTRAQSKPNIVFFLVDDLGYSDVGCYGSSYYETPAIDKLASEGMRFTQAYASSTLCSPTRASILTGKNPARLHITHAIPILGYKRIMDGKGTPLKDADYVMNLPLEEVTIAEALKPAGYATASIGKWHVSEELSFFPQKQGFDVNVGGDGHGATGEYFYPYAGKWRMTKGSPYVEWNTLPNGKKNEYLTDRLTEEAIDFIDQHKDRPFFLYLSHYAVHTPIQAKEELIRKYQNKPADTVSGHANAGYAAMIQSVDESLKTVVTRLDELGLTENTIIVFTSDNGGHGKITNNYPFRGNKGNFYEGGLRIPLIVKWPKVIQAATISNTPVISADLYPTLLQMADLPLMPEQHMDGLSMKTVLQGSEGLGREAMYWHFPNYTGAGHPNPSKPLSVLRYKDWKLIESLETNNCELYHLKLDEQEKNDVAMQNPGVVTKLRKMLNEWRTSTKVQMPEVNPDFSGAAQKNKP